MSSLDRSTAEDALRARLRDCERVQHFVFGTKSGPFWAQFLFVFFLGIPAAVFVNLGLRGMDFRADGYETQTVVLAMGLGYFASLPFIRSTIFIFAMTTERLMLLTTRKPLLGPPNLIDARIREYPLTNGQVLLKKREFIWDLKTPQPSAFKANLVPGNPGASEAELQAFAEKLHA